MSTPVFALPAPHRAHARGPLTAALVALIAVACTSPASTPTATQTPGSSPSAAPSSSAEPSMTGAIEHKTGATDVVLRVESGGGFVPIDFLATQAPTFTLYGNGVIVFQPRVETFPQPDASGATKGVPWRTATLDESQIQQLLEFALGAGGLGAARESYVDDTIADAPNTIFTIHAGGIDKTVTVNALSEAPPAGADAPARAAFFKLASRLQDFDDGGRIPSDVYRPTRFRGVLIEREAQPGISPLAWPWPSIPFAEFKAGPQDGSGPTTFPHRTLTFEEAAALPLDGIEGGVQGLPLKAANDKIYGLVLRPLLAEETE